MRTELDDASIRDFRANVRGKVLLPGETGYDQARKVWNGMIDRHPAIIAQCTGASDVIQSILFAKLNNLTLAVRGGGHSASGNAVCERGLMIDLSPMKGIRVDPLHRTARAEPGVLLSEFDRECQAFGLATTAGVVPTTGIAGLTLGGGVGFLARKHGLACDNLLSVDVVTAKGELLSASQSENPDLFWGVRGGGGNFGVVTSFEYRLHQVGPQVLGGSIVYPFDQAKKVLTAFSDYSLSAPDDLAVNAILLTLPSREHAVLLQVCYVGAPENADEVLRPLLLFGSPIAVDIKPISYLEMQAGGEAVFPYGQQYYWKSGFVRQITTTAIETLIELFPSVSSPRSLIVYQQYGGAITRVPQGQTAFANRDAEYDFLVISIWTDPGEAAVHIEWARNAWKAMQTFTTGSFYVNNLLDEDNSKVRVTYGQNWSRLAALKRTYDPQNLFALNANVPPT